MCHRLGLFCLYSNIAVKCKRLNASSQRRSDDAKLAGLMADTCFSMQAEQVQQNQKSQPGSMEFPSKNAPAVKSGSDFQLPEGNQWRYSEFINAVQAGKVERVRFSKDGSILQVWTVCS